MLLFLILFFKQKAAYEMSISDWSSDVCSSDLAPVCLSHVGEGWPGGVDSRYYRAGRQCAAVHHVASPAHSRTGASAELRAGKPAHPLPRRLSGAAPASLLPAAGLLAGRPSTVFRTYRRTQLPSLMLTHLHH